VADTRNDRIQKWPANLADSPPIPSYGGSGSTVGTFNYIEDLDVGPDGRVWIADTRNNRIQVFNPATSTFTAYGSAGAGNGQFSQPQGIAVSATNVFVADTNNNRIQKLTLTGAWVASFSTGLLGPQGIALAPDGSLWVADTGNDRILHLSDALVDLGETFGTAGTGDLQFDLPHTLAVSGSKLYVADTFNDRVQVFEVGGPAPDTTRPTVSIAVPTQDQVFPNGPITFSGSAADNVGVTAVRVAIKDRTTNLWWRSNGTWGAYQLQNATLGTPGGTSTTWSYAWTPPTTAGSYSVLAESADAAGNVANPKPTNRFSVTAGGGGGGFEATYSRQVFNAGGIAPVYPAGGATDPSNGDRYIADSGGSRIVKISSSGVQTTVSSAGWNDPRDLEFDVADPNILWVADTSDSQIVQMTRTGSIVSTFGGPSAFQTPYGLANDASGVYVADTYNQRIQKISKTNGSVLWTQTTCFGTAFSRPRDVAVGPDGNLYVADTDNNRIVRLNPTDGSCLFTFGSTGGGLAQFRSPRSLTSDGSTGLWIADAGNNRLKRHLVDGTFVGQAGSFGEGNAQFRSAHCVFRDGVNVDVCDTFNYRIEQFRVNALGKPYFGSVIGGTRPANGGFNGAFDVAYAPDGSMYAVDWFNHRIQKFDAAGNFLLAFGGYSSNDGSLIFPRGVTVASNGNVVVMDSENNRIDVFSSTGTFMSKIKPPTGQTQFLRPYQVAIAPNGTYWVADTGNNRIVNINASGTVLASWTTGFNQPRGVAVDASGNVYVSNGGTSRVDKYSSTGTLLATLASPGSGPSNVQGPYGLRIVGTGSSAMLLIADAGNNRVVAMALDGTPLGSFGAPGTGNGQFNSPRGMDRNPLTGEIAVADFMNNRLSIWTTA
jgi:DNA-binding beta-propeller fold protein YncE